MSGGERLNLSTFAEVINQADSRQEHDSGCRVLVGWQRQSATEEAQSTPDGDEGYNFIVWGTN